ncbi:hypothetical protein COCC4DRAFT_143923 [Bipolaris maydis ATCC 48331]|uniref:Uncharacterized protein n=1 Tax=Cochliobolus heterostrophus (strain C4 / ATCC 48331 / race T) TaxID=665024 RepID=N4X406_COCH4|nr:uncharacterized protein COCC4DRAFT_143923 [Bipolaris maydis ATCC 48331]ENI03218.1 hypothetical protein COCC4DRAFT_143923 [Bipolaris maydis ATCC 48331]KAJ6192151.1 hypothetical protein J3E72DRAFT_204496 [Bipolaris maydis]KAJ6203528.1 hypothetical protein PSV09DRAFT_2205675 [Bipolaris maydis]
MTLKQTPRVLRCWLRSWTPSFLPYPFELPQREQTRRRYYVIHERFLCYIFRILALSRSIKEPTSEISGLQLTTAQLAMMNHIWSRFSNVSQQADCGVLLQPSLDGVHENLFQLLVMFWTDLSHDGNMSRSAIMHFSGVLGIHPTELFFRKPYNYTPFISALLWVGRLIILEQTAVSIAKKHLPGLVAPFDPSTPKDYNGFLQLLAFQTGHRPVTHASAYALEHGFPTKLQPDLIDRYLVNSHMWHEFTLTREEDVLDDSLADARYASSSTSQVDYCPDNVNARRLECGTPEESDVNLSDEPSPRQRQEERQQRRKKRGRESRSCSPFTRKIHLMQEQLDGLIKERAISKRTRASR